MKQLTATQRQALERCADEEPHALTEFEPRTIGSLIRARLVGCYTEGGVIIMDRGLRWLRAYPQTTRTQCSGMESM